ncbi:AbrB/MazE/SpoVT family DNA-binding domain-containing protein [Sphingomonas sp.]|uniref:AbrB/MazE/SpoVT family DNA-binding domain-containing protein n=1 Tax=Sphingomonas sp. TaxID=28214 RepID=UPI000DB1EC49|nr:AbrB/MazE/SpoVT family DNA-binding domain-containing protein [Sphingomonas sp.]PZU10930.1 MAG: AbrB/MazE/SpoVT family DNA-binding domain-containing protein [Sphingomonas sp.]
MNMPLKLVKIGNSTGVILPKELLARLGAEQGDTVSAFGTDRGIELRPQDDDFESQMAAAREVMARRARALRELAK